MKALKELHDNVVSASERIRAHVLQTPLLESLELERLANNKVFIKLESEQLTGSFKIRGAFNKLCLTKNQHGTNISPVTSSSGNHALACVHAMTKLGTKGTIFLPNTVSKTKETALRATGTELVLYGKDCLDAEMKARQTSEEQERPFISPYNDFDVLAGNGTIAVEILSQLPDVDCILVPVGGGGMIAGMASYIKHVKPTVQVIGCQPVKSKVMYESVKAGQIIFEESYETLSDGTAGGIEDGSVTFPMCRDYVDDWILTCEEDIERGIKFMVEQHHKIVEGAAGVAIGGYMANAQKFRGKTVAIVSGGANIGTDKLIDILTNK